MKNLIYACVFYQSDYLILLEILLESIYKKGNIQPDTDILIITLPGFKDIIEPKIEYMKLPIKYYLLDIYDFYDSCCSRLRLFEYEHIDLYDNILYLDTDVLINNDMNLLFKQEIDKTKLYAIVEGTINGCYWGSDLFDLTKVDNSITGFSSGVLYFKNSPEIRELFSVIKNHIQTYVGQHHSYPEGVDQPFFVYNAITRNQYDNQFLLEFGENNPTGNENKKIIYHFPGGIGWFTTKLERMRGFLEQNK
jgi:lipopolysaccharide biosynthesis glycosyltransferase